MTILKPQYLFVMKTTQKTPVLLRTPISYYGGKQMMLPHILPKIPQHKVYVEPFFGGGAVFWAKPRSKAEIINDVNDRLITFYQVLKYDFDKLQMIIDDTFHSRHIYQMTKEIYKGDILDPIRMGWAVWVQANMSFSSNLGGGFAYDRNAKCSLTHFNKKTRFTVDYQERLKNVTIESNDILKVIKAYDSPDAFFYLDPPYVSSDQGHYKGYTTEDFKALLIACSSMKGKFLLSSYPEPVLLDFIRDMGWNIEKHEKKVSVTGKRSTEKTKIECLTWNY